MENIVINETPVRTSNNFAINNIKLKNVEIPSDTTTFRNVDIISKNSIIEENLQIPRFTYGLGEILEENISKNENNRIRLIIKDKDSVDITYNFNIGNTELINYIEIIANDDADIIIKYKSEIEAANFNNSKIKLIAKKEVKVNVTIVNLLNDESNNFLAIENDIYENSDVRYTIVDLGAKKSVCNCFANVLGKESNYTLKTIYLGIDNQIKDINYIAELKGENTNVDIDVQGALKDYAKKNFKGTIDFKKGAKKSKGNETEYCMLLSENARAIALPMLLCTEDDVEGNHATASGEVDKAQLFYIMSRGFNKKEAIKLMVRARFENILNGINNENIKKDIIEQIDRRLEK